MISNHRGRVKNCYDELMKLTELVKPQEIKDQMEYLEAFFKHSTWNDISPDDLRAYSILQKREAQWNQLWNTYDDCKVYLEVLEEDGTDPDEEILDLEFLEMEIQKLKLELMFNGKYDHNDVIVNIHAGAGGKEAQDWCRMLLQMYMGWATKKGFDVKLLDWQEGEDGSVIKSVSIEIKGENVYGLLSAENGVHRLVRVSPFDSQNRRHTSFAAVEVIPSIEWDDSLVGVDMRDVRVDTFRSSGKGGQHVNKTESAVRLTHIPTGIVVACQEERSQHQNKAKAMKMLISKLTAIKEREQLESFAEIQGDKYAIEWGNQIRSYVFMPYQMVKDHRTNHQTSNINAVMDGDIDEFIFKSLAN